MLIRYPISSRRTPFIAPWFYAPIDASLNACILSKLIPAFASAWGFFVVILRR